MADRDETFIDLGGIRLTKKAATLIATALLAVPGGGQYAATAFGLLDPSGAAAELDGQLQANVHLIELYSSQLDDMRGQRDQAQGRADSLTTIKNDIV